MASVGSSKSQYVGHVVGGSVGQLRLAVLQGTMEGKRRQWLDGIKQSMGED